MIRDDYFNWLCGLVCEKRFGVVVSFERLLWYLHNIEFRYIIPLDRNRAENGISLRYRFAGDDCVYLDGPCSVLEMMVALAVHCEEDIMDDPAIGDRTGQWFWGMIANLGLGSMNDRNFDRRYVDDVIERFLDREYEPDGRGGLFRIRNCDRDLRKVEIQHQMYWYLNSIT